MKRRQSILLLGMLATLWFYDAVASEDPSRRIQALVDLLDAEERTQAAAGWRLIEIGAPAVPALMTYFAHGDSASRRTSGSILAHIGEPAVPSLIAALGEPQLRPDASSALAFIGTPTVPHLLDALLRADQRRDHELQIQIGSIFHNMGAVAVPALVAALGTNRTLGAVTALANIGPPAIPALVEELRGAGERAIPSAHVLELIARRDLESARDIASRLVPLLGDSQSAARASITLGRIGLPAIPALARALEDRDPARRLHAVMALGLMDPRIAAPAIPALRDALAVESDAGIREIIRATIEQLR